jgi:tetratricopeptide (TPR) repeat protein
MNARRVLLSAAAIVTLIGCGRAPQQPAPAAPPAPPPAAAPMAGMPPVPASLADWAKGAQLFDGLGSFHRRASTSSPDAQRYFDQGMRLLWAFNHDESTRSFARAAELDPKCAICLWGVALTVGPNYNQPMMAKARAQVAWDALQQADALAGGASPAEQALIAALGKRYAGPVALDPSNEGPLLKAYADAMRTAAQQFPGDDDVQTLFAEALMNTNAWKLWSRDGKPAAGTLEIVATLEAVLARNPQHPGATHSYIHAVEASPHPEKAVAAAERLGPMAPAAGHLVHMPAHIMQRVGRYEEAADANRKAAAADTAYFSRTRPPDYYPYYLGHNYQFLAYATAMEGRRAETLDAVRHLRDAVPESLMLGMAGIDWYGAEEYLAMVRFGLWDELLAVPAPNPQLKALTGGYLFGRTLALAAKGRQADAVQTLAQLEQLANEVPPDMPAGLSSAKEVLAVAVPLAQGRLAASAGRTDESLRLLADAVAREDALPYDEPADWFFPVRHLLGAELMKAGRAAEAERVYREDLRHNPDNGWSLFGLSQALAAQHKDAAAREAEARFRSAWQHADVTLSSSAL